jgi:16S rRNA (guanine966-N2)-methyltransferase
MSCEGIAFLAATPEKFDLVFLDPPYASDLAQRALDLLPGRLSAGARVYVESADRLQPDHHRWRILREDRAGAVRYALFEPATP